MTEEEMGIELKNTVNEWVTMKFAGRTYNEVFNTLKHIKECLETRRMNSNSEIIEEIPNS